MKFVICVVIASIMLWVMWPHSGGDAGRNGETLSDILKSDAGMIKGEPLLTASKAKYTFVYFSAGWCGPCHQFTPQLVNLWQEAGKGRDFNVVFVSCDNSERDMMSYMEETGMTWSYVKFGSSLIQRLQANFGENGIPNLVLFDDKGAALARSFEGETYVGPASVLEHYRRLH